MSRERPAGPDEPFFLAGAPGRDACLLVHGSTGTAGDMRFFGEHLDACGYTVEGVLPLSPTGYGNSPYQGLSAFAGNPMLISPEKLVQIGHLSKADLRDAPEFPVEQVDFGPVMSYKEDLLERAFANFRSGAPAGQREAFADFCDRQAYWLDDFALFMALKQANTLRPWYEWEPDIAARRPEALARWRQSLAGEIGSHKYQQWQFFEQWLALKGYANGRGIRIIGDIPIFVSLDSTDVWANTPLFYLDETLQPTVVSGVPPDYFSETGQLWGNPVYRWSVLKGSGYRWWMERIAHNLKLFDVLRIDHFLGLVAYRPSARSEGGFPSTASSPAVPPPGDGQDPCRGAARLSWSPDRR